MPANEQPKFDDHTNLLLAEVKLGLQVEDFLRSDVGKFLVGRAADEADAAMGDLKKVDAEDTKAIREIQNRIWRAESIAQWLHDAITGGKNAEAQLQDQEAHAEREDAPEPRFDPLDYGF